jgi:hypothetical protein
MTSAGAANAGTLKIYADTNFKGLIGTYADKAGSYVLSAANRGVMSSFKNDTSRWVAFYKGANFNGGCFPSEPNHHAASFYLWDDNSMSSFRIGNVGC